MIEERLPAREGLPERAGSASADAAALVADFGLASCDVAAPDCAAVYEGLADLACALD